ncbi:hypothetical protein CJF32_00000371 [Rutstroemia sp. NJR-2017a WRK4]|nr:hypothetical protein CJF32_00000371 [Rutstroemia sp. NJR-2017a WRK4]
MSPPPFLTTLPREIRDHIYTYILASPDGSVTLSPWSIDIARSLSILRTSSKERPQTVEEFRDVIQLRENGETVDGRLFQAYATGSRDERASRLPSQWDMVVNTAWPRLSPWAKRKWLAEMLLDPADTTHLLHKLHSLFPGELYIDGILFLKDNKQVVNFPRLDPRDGEIKILTEKRRPNVLKKVTRLVQPATMLHLLRDIPRELRDQIYQYAFQTPQSCVTFRSTINGSFQILPYDPQNDSCLSNYSIPSIGLLSTCTQIHHEAQYILWKQNSLGLWPSDVFCNWGDLPERAFEKVQHVEVNLDLTDSDDLNWAERAFKRFSVWSAKGSLRRVTINPMREEKMKLDVKWMQRVEEAIDMRRKNEKEQSGKSAVDDEGLNLYGQWMTLFKEAGGNEGYLGKDVEKMVVIKTCWDKWERKDQSSWLQKRRSGDAAQMEAVMADFNKTFGGELWANGELCYKDQQRIRRVFTLKPLLQEPTPDETCSGT